MPLLISRYCPYLDIVQDVREIHDGLAATMRKAEHLLQVRRNLPFPIYPVSGPLAAHAPRTGLPVTGTISLGVDPEPADASMLAKERARNDSRNTLYDKLSNSNRSSFRFADDFEEIAKEDDYIAVLHADANNLGTIVTSLLKNIEIESDEKVADIYMQFSEAVATATETAAKSALSSIPPTPDKKYFPYRPLVCAGDDLTLVLRAQDAYSFSEQFLAEFAFLTKKRLTELELTSANDVSLTACIGIAFVKPNYPFVQAYELSESLCKYAKETTKRKASAIAFWRVTSHLTDNFKTILQGELTAGRLRLTMMPYALDDNRPDGVPSLSQLRSLAEALNQELIPRGSYRELLTEMHRGKEYALQAFERILDVARSRGNRYESTMTELLRSLADITGKVPTNADSLFRNTSSARSNPRDPDLVTPIHDALELLEAGISFSKENKG